MIVKKPRTLSESRRSDITGSLMSKFNFRLDNCSLVEVGDDGSWLITSRYHPKFDFLDLEYHKPEKTLYILYKVSTTDQLNPEEEQFEAYKMPVEANMASKRWNSLLRESR